MVFPWFIWGSLLGPWKIFHCYVSSPEGIWTKSYLRFLLGPWKIHQRSTARLAGGRWPLSTVRWCVVFVNFRGLATRVVGFFYGILMEYYGILMWHTNGYERNIMGYYGILMDMNGFDPPVMKHRKSHSVERRIGTCHLQVDDFPDSHRDYHWVYSWCFFLFRSFIKLYIIVHHKCIYIYIHIYIYISILYTCIIHRYIHTPVVVSLYPIISPSHLHYIQYHSPIISLFCSLLLKLGLSTCRCSRYGI